MNKAAVKNGSLEMLMWIVENDQLPSPQQSSLYEDNLQQSSLYEDNLHILAARGRHHDITRWLLASCKATQLEGCTLDCRLFARAVKEEKKYVWKYLRKYGCEWDCTAYDEIVKEGKFDQVIALRTMGCPLDLPRAIRLANGRMKRWLISQQN
jgi:hypothetical protein